MSADEVISVGICAHNEEDTIGKLINQILDEEVPLKEIIVVVAGNDSTSSIVESKQESSDKVDLIKEKEREGQIAAQNKIISRASGDAIALIDGDGLIEEGSLERLYSEYNGSNVAAGKEVPKTEDSFTGKIIETHGNVHHQLCLTSPRFSTHLGIFPSDLIDSFPRIVLDDACVENKAKESNLPIKYVSDSVKIHNTPNNLIFFFHQQKKNWAGRFEATEKGLWHSKPDSVLAKVYLKELLQTSVKSLPYMISLAFIELAAYSSARIHQITGKFPVKWKRPLK